MKVTFLGTGTSSGVPMIGCDCNVCKSDNPKDNRLRTSILLSTETENYTVDCGPDFRQQMLTNNVKELHGILYTHEHKDHTAGLDDVRGFNHIMQKSISLYATQRVENALRNEFSYIFSDKKYPGIPQVNITTIENNQPFNLGSIPVIPIEVLHLNLPVLGFRFYDFTYITDANFIADEELEKIKGSKILVLNALRHQQHISHFNLDEAISLAQKINAEKTYFTHISHQLGLHNDVENTLPKNIHLAFDGLSFVV